MDSLEMDQDSGVSASSPSRIQRSKSPPKSVITVEDSMEKIDDLLNELGNIDTNIESQDDGLDPQLQTPQSIASTKSSSSIRFSLYPRKITQTQKHNINQLSQLKSLFKCILSTNNQSKLLPIRTNSKVLHLRTTDQINELTPIGAINFFKPNKGTSKTLTGDFHISSPLSYEELEAHPKIASWLGMNGYNIIKCECQTSDMVLIGILSRVQHFAWRADQRDIILNTPAWKENPFYLRLYPGTLSCNSKSTMTNVMMVEVDRSNITSGIQYFQTHFDGVNKLSPSNIPYSFYTLYQNRLNDEERLEIIKDSKRFTDCVSILHMKGIADIDQIVTLKRNIKVKLRTLLLRIPVKATSTQVLFHQIEKQKDNQNGSEWLTCAFYTVDTKNVLSSLPKLAALIKQYTDTEDHDKIFNNCDHKLYFETKTIPVKNGQLTTSSKPVPIETQEHTAKMLGRIQAIAPKRESANSVSNEIRHNMLRKQNSPPDQTTAPSASPPAINPEVGDDLPPAERRLAILEQNILQGNHRMDKLENICLQLKHNTDVISTQIQQLAQDLYRPESPSVGMHPNKAARTSD
jgi:hypothetical protein